MPQEHQKRGRREQKKKEREDADRHAGRAKRQKIQAVEEGVGITVHDAREDQEDAPQHGNDTTATPRDFPFYGLLEEEEQEYFKRADSLLEANQFRDTEERNLFLANVYREANGKELKIADSQSCSRLMERLILLSTAEQLKAIFQKFSGHFLDLVQHRFGSHCCEALLLRAAPIVSQELKSGTTLPKTDIDVSMEDLFLSTASELESSLGFLISDVFASHPLRVLLVVLSGMPLAASSTTDILQSKRKENVSVANGPTALTHDTTPRTVPSSFHIVVDKILTITLTGLDTSYLRALTTQPIANPVLQLLLELELTRSGKESAKDAQSLLRKLLPDDPLVEGTDSASFIQYLLYDPVGSRLLEVIITHAPGKIFKALYRGVLKEKLGTTAKNEVAAFVVIKLIERLSKNDLESAIEQICPHLDVLIKRSRTAVIKSLIERCRARAVDTQPIADALQQLYGEELPQKLVEMLQIASDAVDHMSEGRKKQLETQNNSKIHTSLLAQVMLEAPGPLRELVNNSLLTIEPCDLKNIAKDRTASRVIQAALTGAEQSTKFRRLFIQRFGGLISDLATDTVASHVVDALWDGTSGLKYLKERIADEMVNHEIMLRETMPGRAVWRNWKMDLYKGRSREWSEDTKDQHLMAKTGIQLARERHAMRSSDGQPK
ncbi:MAG: hypothetical protein Q9217_001013 [Psora testacea]